MISSKKDALTEIRTHIRGCFGRVDLIFAGHPSDTGRAKELRTLAKRWHLGVEEIKSAIYPTIEAWIEREYMGFADSRQVPWHESPIERRKKTISMVDEAIEYLRA